MASMTLACAALLVARVAAQGPAGASAPAGTVESDPIKCWWKTDKNAVHVGERFTLVLTCAVVDTSRLVYLLSVPAFFLFLTSRVLESRRWR